MGRQRLKRGQLLVEMKPLHYEITSFTNGQLRDVTSSDVTLERPIHLTPDQFGGKYIDTFPYHSIFGKSLFFNMSINKVCSNFRVGEY